MADIPNLPLSWAGRRVALLADLQIGALLANTGTIRRIVRRLVRERPAVVLLAGDLLYDAAPCPGPQTAAVGNLLQPLVAAGIPTFAVLGNHDYAPGSAESDAEQRRVARTLREQLDGAGIHVLQNEAVALESPPAGGGDIPPGWPLYVVGVGERATGSD